MADEKVKEHRCEGITKGSKIIFIPKGTVADLIGPWWSLESGGEQWTCIIFCPWCGVKLEDSE